MGKEEKEMAIPYPCLQFEVELKKNSLINVPMLPYEITVISHHLSGLQ